MHACTHLLTLHRIKFAVTLMSSTLLLPSLHRYSGLLCSPISSSVCLLPYREGLALNSVTKLNSPWSRPRQTHYSNCHRTSQNQFDKFGISYPFGWERPAWNSEAGAASASGILCFWPWSLIRATETPTNRLTVGLGKIEEGVWSFRLERPLRT